HHRSSRGGGRGSSRSDPRPRVLRGGMDREGLLAGRHRRLGDRARGMAHRVAEQAEVAVSLADVVLFIVDANVGVTTTDEQLLRVLRKAQVPIVLVANKVDDQRGELEAAALWNLGLGEPHAVSALHGRGSGDLLDAVVAAMPEEGRGAPADRGPRRVA